MAGVSMAQLCDVRSVLAAAGILCGLLAFGATEVSAALPPYLLVGSYALPAGGGAIDVLPNGQLIAVQSDGRVLVQSALNSGSYLPFGAIGSGIFDGPFGNFGASFVSVSPDGSRMAIGDNGAFNRVHFVEISALDPMSTTPTTSAEVPNFDGAWAGDSTMFVSGFGASAGAWRVDADGLAVTQVVQNGAGGPGGVAVRDGRVFIGDGFNTSDGGTPTGNVRAFELAALSAAASSVSFDAGLLVADALSASPVRFDADGNMLLGGGDFFAGSDDFGYAAVIDGEAILAALAGGPLAPDAAELRLSPAGGFAYYGIEFNEFTGELLVFADGMAYRYAVPAPGSAAVFALCGLATMRRARRQA